MTSNIMMKFNHDVMMTHWIDTIPSQNGRLLGYTSVQQSTDFRLKSMDSLITYLVM